MRAFGPRFLVEALFLGLVAAVAYLARLAWEAVVLVMFLAWLLVSVFEIAISRAGSWPGQEALRRRRERRRDAAPAPLASVPNRPHVQVLPRESEPAAQPVLERAVEHEPAPEPDAPPVHEPTPPVAEQSLAEPTPEPERPSAPPPLPPQPEREPEPERGRPQLEVVADPEPEPQREPEPQPEPDAGRVIALPLHEGPREWNLWELERIARESAGGDAARDDERSYLLMYLREFATAEGTLPVEFDPLVRESFGDVLASAR